LNNTRLGEKCRKNLKKSSRLNKELSFDQIVNNSFDRFNGFDTNVETVLDGIKKTVRFKQSIPPNVDNSEKARYSNQYNNDKMRSQSNYLTEVDLNQNENLPVLTGVAIFNNPLTSFLYDSGTRITIINESLYVKIKQEDPKTVLEPYKERPIFLSDKRLYVYGQVHLRKCQFSNNLLNNELIIVTNHKSNYECVIGQNIRKCNKNVPELIGNYKNELMRSNKDFYKRENRKLVTANYLSKNVYLKSKYIKPELQSKSNKNHISNRNFTNRKYFQENKNPKVNKQNIFLNKNKPENCNTQPKMG
ncbi:unnamed protein product, partial [Brachionus calyciflorus]